MRNKIFKRSKKGIKTKKKRIGDKVYWNNVSDKIRCNVLCKVNVNVKWEVIAKVVSKVYKKIYKK